MDSDLDKAIKEARAHRSAVFEYMLGNKPTDEAGWRQLADSLLFLSMMVAMHADNIRDGKVK